MSKRKTYELSDDKTEAFLASVKERAAARKDEPKKPTLRDFLNQDAIYSAIKRMLDDGLPWDVIASAVNDTHGTRLKTTTIRSAYGEVAKMRGEPRRDVVAKRIEERKREREAAENKGEQRRAATPQPAPTRPQSAPVRPQQTVQSATA